jgi:hypothetical protein
VRLTVVFDPLAVLAQVALAQILAPAPDNRERVQLHGPHIEQNLHLDRLGAPNVDGPRLDGLVADAVDPKRVRPRSRDGDRELAGRIAQNAAARRTQRIEQRDGHTLDRCARIRIDGPAGYGLGCGRGGKEKDGECSTSAPGRTPNRDGTPHLGYLRTSWGLLTPRYRRSVRMSINSCRTVPELDERRWTA